MSVTLGFSTEGVFKDQLEKRLSNGCLLFGFDWRSENDPLFRHVKAELTSFTMAG